MGRKSKPERDAKIIQILRETDRPAVDIAEEFGVSGERIRQIRVQANIPPRVNAQRRGRGALVSREPISDEHRGFGARIHLERSRQHLSSSDLSEIAVLSIDRIRAIETGCCPRITLCEMLKLVASLGLVYEEVVTYKPKA
jgi:DNA-binding Xre family transcriptional regulator